MSVPISALVLYVKDIPRVQAFYLRHFGFVPVPSSISGWQLLTNAEGGCSIALHQAAKSQKSGAAIKIVFSVPDVKTFIAKAKKQGFEFGAIHEAHNYCFANAKDPAGNSISISDRAYRVKHA